MKVNEDLFERLVSNVFAERKLSDLAGYLFTRHVKSNVKDTLLKTDDESIELIKRALLKIWPDIKENRF